MTPISVLPVNEAAGYIIPGSERSLTSSWSDGFPLSVKTDAGTGTKWDWGRLQDFRFGRYTAKLVAVYDDGERDVPIEAVVSFWVIPWRIILGTLLVLGFVLVGIVTTLKKSSRFIPKKRERHGNTKA